MTRSEFAKWIDVDPKDLVLVESEDVVVPARIAGAILLNVWFQPIDSLHPRRWVPAH